MTASYARVPDAASDLAQDGLQLGAVLFLYKRADKERWGDFPCADRYLAESIGLSRYAASQLIARLVQHGFAEEAFPGDRHNPRRLRFHPPEELVAPTTPGGRWQRKHIPRHSVSHQSDGESGTIVNLRPPSQPPAAFSHSASHPLGHDVSHQNPPASIPSVDSQPQRQPPLQPHAQPILLHTDLQTPTSNGGEERERTPDGGASSGTEPTGSLSLPAEDWVEEKDFSPPQKPASPPARRRSVAHPYDSAVLEDVLGRACAAITGQPWLPEGGGRGREHTPRSIRTQAQPLLKLLRAQGWPDDLEGWLADLALVARAARECPAPLFSNDIRGENWATKADTSRDIRTLAHPDRWLARLTAAESWAANPTAAVKPASSTPAARPRRGAPGVLDGTEAAAWAALIAEAEASEADADTDPPAFRRIHA